MREDDQQHHCGNVGRHHRQGLDGDMLQRLIGNARCDEHIFTQRWRGKAYAATADKHQTKVDGVNPVGDHDWQQDRRYQHDDGQCLHEHTEEEQEDDHESPDQVDIVGKAENPVGNLIGYLIRCQQIAECRGREDQHQHAARKPGGGVQRGHKGPELQLLVDEDTYEDCIEDGHDSRFCRGEPARVNTAQDDGGCHDRPETILQGVRDVSGGPLQTAAQVTALQLVYHAEGCGDDEAGDEASHEHLGNAHLPGNAVNDHGDTGRDDNANATGCSRGGGRVGRVIAAPPHGRYHQHTHSSRSGRP